MSKTLKLDNNHALHVYCQENNKLFRGKVIRFSNASSPCGTDLFYVDDSYDIEQMKVQALELLKS
ncbi:hypothetical protein [Aneurinibacillus aneurinilyticus]|uniref:hypothetical protein n=1 Tax=Aneurinibacillus aneurinilyticus TaxID=1391 RepID=UPI0023EF8506|nr:hypothetical protein [Aneurinibacillus aneurinilyticus]